MLPACPNKFEFATAGWPNGLVDGVGLPNAFEPDDGAWLVFDEPAGIVLWSSPLVAAGANGCPKLDGWPNEFENENADCAGCAVATTDAPLDCDVLTCAAANGS